MTKAVRPLNSNAAWTEAGLAPVTVGGVVLTGAWLGGVSDEDLAAMGLEAADIAETAAPVLPEGLAATSSLTDVNGVPTRQWSTAAISKAQLAAALTAAIDAERDRRIEGGFTHNGALYQSRQSDRENIATLGVQAQLAVAAGAQAGDLRWHGGPSDFVWIVADNSTVALDAPAMVALFQAGVGFKTALTFAGRAKKDWVQHASRTKAELLAFDVSADW